MVYATFKDVFLKSFVMYLVSLPIYVNLTHFWFSCSCFCRCFVFLPTIQDRSVVFVVMNDLFHGVDFFLFF